MTTKRKRLHFIIRFPNKDLGHWQGEICDSFWDIKLAEDYMKHPPRQYENFYLILAVQDEA